MPDILSSPMVAAILILAAIAGLLILVSLRFIQTSGTGGLHPRDF